MSTERRGITPSQTVGPFFHYGLTPGTKYAVPVTADGMVAGDGAAGDRITVSGRVLDGEGAPVPDAMIEIWQADGAGRFAASQSRANAAFRGFGRSDTDADGWYRFSTVKPGRVQEPGGGLQAPHILVAVFARGMLIHLFTRIYFADEASNDTDAILALVPADRRATLIAAKVEGGYRLDIRLQGEGETVFFAV